jgi:hypothetical protein
MLVGYFDPSHMVVEGGRWGWSLQILEAAASKQTKATNNPIQFNSIQQTNK